MKQDFSRFLRPLGAIGALAVLAACGGGGGDGGMNPPPTGSNVTVSGRITFDRIPFKATLSTGLNSTAPVESPAREVTVEAISNAGGSLASTTTDANGDYSLSVPSNTTIFIRARAEMIKTGTAPTWNFAVLNNTNGDAKYVLDGSSFNSGTANSTRNLRATTTYPTPRNSGPFAILDTVYRAKQLILGASPSANLPALNLFWSINNRATTNVFCPDNGDIGTSFYIGSGENDRCTTQAPLPAGIYILGDFAGGNGDTDEFDAHVIAHEFGHYFEDQFSRSDSIGGQHSLDERLDLRVAFSEGWGDAYGAMTQNDPQYRDSFSGIDQDFSFNIESASNSAPGWFSELSISKIVWDVFDTTAEPNDTVGLGFTPIFNVMTGAQRTTDAQTSIFPFASALRSANQASGPAIDTLLTNEGISTGSNDFGSSESHNGGDASVLPIYGSVALNQPLANVCSTSVNGTESGNKLGNRRFLRFQNDTARIVTIQVTGSNTVASTVAATDPDIFVHRGGTLVAFSDDETPVGQVPARETLSQLQLAAGTYIIEVYDFGVIANPGQPRCMTVSITGT